MSKCRLEKNMAGKQVRMQVSSTSTLGGEWYVIKSPPSQQLDILKKKIS